MNYKYYTIWGVSSFIIVLSIAYFHWQSSEVAKDAMSFSRLLVSYGLYGGSFGSLLGFRILYMYIGESAYGEVAGIKFCLLVWTVVALLLFASYIPYI
ncbi:MAG: hypothetical protein GY787_15995 [Alteromonadales bacterium]|nr:hypothetical protein [Alteromonadales bacterium]